jgi:hypothetical protein
VREATWQMTDPFATAPAGRADREECYR